MLSHCAFSLPAILAGTMAHAIGLRPTTDAYGLPLVALAILTAASTGIANVAARRRALRS